MPALQWARLNADLNLRFLGREGPTDVLAFPIDDEAVESGRSPDSGGSGPGVVPPEPSELPMLLGDVVICPDVAREAATRCAPTAASANHWNVAATCAVTAAAASSRSAGTKGIWRPVSRP